jgi:glucose/arabinose dehydrogenase
MYSMPLAIWGAGQFANRLRPNNAQNPASYEGKILRFNTVSDGDAGAAAWIPNDNPYSATSAIWSIGIRNNQGFAYNLQQMFYMVHHMVRTVMMK